MEYPYNPKRSFLFHAPADFALKMAPMIDMIFLLLIFFLVCAKWMGQEKLIPFGFARAYAGQSHLVKAEPLKIQIASAVDGCTVQIGKSGKIEIKNATVENDLAGFLDKLNTCLTAQRRYATDPVELVCDGRVKWDYFAKIYNVLYGAGVTDIAIVMTEDSQ